LVPDPLSGLPGRAYAEAELARAQGDPADCFLALFVVKLLARRPSAAQGVVRVVQAMPDYNNLFRWAPCAFLTVAPPKTSYKELRARVQMIELTPMTPTLEWEGRSAMVPVLTRHPSGVLRVGVLQCTTSGRLRV
jgi:hypothetical protein